MLDRPDYWFRTARFKDELPAQILQIAFLFMETFIPKIAIDARLPNVGQGGVQQVVLTLADGMAKLESTLVKRVWIVLKGTSWWNGRLPQGDEVIEVSAPLGRISLWVANRLPKFTSKVFPVVSALLPSTFTLDTVLRGACVDVVHLPFQDGFNTALPFVYHPHDLQHKYFPEFFSSLQRRHRESKWRQLAMRAQVVMAASDGVRNDLQKFWSIPSSKISVVPIPPPERKKSDSHILSLVPANYGLYPAALWPHKNHVNLVHAIRILRDEGINIPIVLVGSPASEHKTIQHLIRKYALEDCVRYLGHVSNEHLTSLIQASNFVVVPSLFEAMSLVVWDAQILGTPVLCSQNEPFRQQVGDSAITFDPLNPRAIAEAIRTVLGDRELRQELIKRGHCRTVNLTSENFALAMIREYFRALSKTPPLESIAANVKLASFEIQ